MSEDTGDMEWWRMVYIAALGLGILICVVVLFRIGPEDPPTPPPKPPRPRETEMLPAQPPPPERRKLPPVPRHRSRD